MRQLYKDGRRELIQTYSLLNALAVFNSSHTIELQNSMVNTVGLKSIKALWMMLPALAVADKLRTQVTSINHVSKW